jgi:hypothetical protein
MLLMSLITPMMVHEEAFNLAVVPSIFTNISAGQAAVQEFSIEIDNTAVIDGSYRIPI